MEASRCLKCSAQNYDLQQIQVSKCLNLAHPVAASQASHALAVDNGGARLIVFRLGDPHLLKGAEGSQDGATDPDAVLPLRWSDHLPTFPTESIWSPFNVRGVNRMKHS